MGKKTEPLTESYFYIMLCLFSGPCHGYGIMQKTLELSAGRVQIGSGTMYGAVSNMMKKGWITELERALPRDERPKRLYELTPAGRKILTEEILRLKELLHSAEIITNHREDI